MAEQGVEEQVIHALDAMAAADKTPTGYKLHKEPEAAPEEGKGN